MREVLLLAEITAIVVRFDGTPGKDLFDGLARTLTTHLALKSIRRHLALLRIHQHVITVLAQLVDLFAISDPKTLDHERGLQPGPVERAHEHADFKVGCVDFDGLQHGPGGLRFGPFKDG